MNSRDAILLLKDVGFKIDRTAKGDHVILRKGKSVIVISNGKQELSSGMTKKVRTYARK